MDKNPESERSTTMQQKKGRRFRRFFREFLQLRFWIAASTGVALSFSAPDYSWFALSFVAWLPLLWAIRGQGAKRAMLYGTAAGFFAVLLGYNWMVELTTRFGGLSTSISWVIHLIFSTIHGLQWGIATGLSVPLARRHPDHAIWIFALAWPCMELFFPALFPVNGAFYWAEHPRWIQLAQWGGAPLVGALHVLVSALALHLLLAKDRASRVRRFVLYLAVMIAIPVFGEWQIRRVEAWFADAEKISIGVVQSDAGISTRRKLRNQVLQGLQSKSAELEAQGAKLIVWGETVYPFGGFYRDSTEDFPDGDRRKVQVGFSTPVLFGLTTRERHGDARRPYNTAWLMDEHGQLGARYDKNIPLWFGEYVPLVDPDWYLETFPNASYMHRGPGPSVIEWEGIRMGPMICYEILLSDYVQQTVDQDISILMNLTNDSWFGATREQSEHLALAVIRTVETRRPLVRAVSAGISAYVDPAGQIVDSLPRTNSDELGYHGANGFVAEVPLIAPEYRTFYTWVGGHWKWLYPLFLGIVVWSCYRFGGRRTSYKYGT